VHVSRLRQGETLLATNLIGTCYECTFQNSEGAKGEMLRALCQIKSVLPDFGEPSNNIHLIQGMISQPARWEFLLEKATELGVRVICPVETSRTEHRSLKLDRAERILR